MRGVLDSHAREVLSRELADRGCEALLVVGASGRDPDLAPFVGPAHLSRAFLLLPRPSGGSDTGRGPLLGYLTAMERDEAAKPGYELLTPAALEVERLLRERPETASFWGALLARALELAGVPHGRLALAGHLGAGHAVAFAGALAGAGWSLVDGHEVVLLLRKRKRAGEVASIREAARGAAAAMRRVAEVLAAAEPEVGKGAATPGAFELGRQLRSRGEPLTVAHLRREVFRVIADHGLEQPEDNIIAPAEEGAAPHSMGTDSRVLRAGESLIVDLFPRGRLFADCTRTFCVGEPPEPLAAAHAAVERALAIARAGARPGVRGFALQEAVCRHFQDLGHATPVSHPGTVTGYVHNLGHGVGHELHEYPSFRKEAGAEGVLGEGDVIAVEPGLYDPEAGWGVRLEDLVVLGEDGIAEDLTPLPYELDPRAWRG
ncbi:MAG TPA: M24 family metallopeptidase [Thermoanaerobaculia bacterium]|nr:M24 family metallopeptidase [Thermoanaerobaculia bacterium]